MKMRSSPLLISAVWIQLVALAPGASCQGLAEPPAVGQGGSAQDRPFARGRAGRALLRRFDADGDGHLAEGERARARAFFMRFDRDGDGRLSQDERLAFRRAARGAGAQKAGRQGCRRGICPLRGGQEGAEVIPGPGRQETQTIAPSGRPA